MKRNVYSAIASLFGLLFVLAACNETSEEYRYENWEERNRSYIDSIASVAQQNTSGEWKILKSCTLPPDNPYDISFSFEPLNYIYAKVLEDAGTGDAPLYNDTVRVHYRGKLINGDVFDQSYKGTLNLNTAVPSKFKVSALINGWTTALQQMKEGDRWEIYIPWTLGYGPDAMTSSTTILDYSVLCFDLKLVRIYPEELYNSSNPVPEWR